MKRIVPLIGVLFFGCVAYGMYHLAYEVKRLEDELIAYNRALVREREAIDILKAEWSYLSRPDRLQAQANRNLKLEAPPLHRLVKLGDLPERPSGAQVEGWGVILVPDPSIPPPPLAKPSPEKGPGTPSTVPVGIAGQPDAGQFDTGPRRVAMNGVVR